MTEEQAVVIIELLKSIETKLNRIEVNTNGLDKADSNLDDVVGELQNITEAVQMLHP